MKSPNVVMRSLFTLLTLVVLLVSDCLALQLASVFTDNVVLQRDRPAPIWGTAEPHHNVQVRLGNDTAEATADSAGRWIAYLGPLRANRSPSSLEIRSGDKTVALANVLVGDVWLCSGQSNMQMTLGEADGGKEFSERHGDAPLLRLLVVPKQFTATAQEAQGGKWTAVTPEAARKFSAVGFSFGATLAAAPSMQDVPIGLIDSSFGGTTVEGWIPEADLQSFDRNDLGNSMFGQPAEHYNAMIRPLVPMAIRGVVWYQGESNSDRPAVYGKLLKQMIEARRRDFRNAELPFILVQLPAYNAPFQTNFFTWIREQQQRVAEATDGVSLVVSYDTHDGSDLHPREKIPIGKRVANTVAATEYGESLASSGPTYKGHAIDGGRVRVKFDTHGVKLATSDDAKAVRGFQLAGGDGEFRFARAVIVDDNTVEVSSPHVAEPKYVRFAWAGVPNANLVSTAGLPSAPFRTDEFQPDDLEFIRVPTHRAVKTTRYELEIDALGSLRSLGVGGEQFIANGVGMNGGSCIPTFFGPRNLNQVEEISPRQLVFRDSEASVTYRFDLDGMRIEVSNQSASDFDFRISLAPGLEIAGQSKLQLKQGKALVHADGFEAASATAERTARLEAAIPAGATRTLRLRVGEEP